MRFGMKENLEIHSRCDSLFEENNFQIVSMLNPEDLIPGLDLDMMLREMYWAADGYIRFMLEAGALMQTPWKRNLQG